MGMRIMMNNNQQRLHIWLELKNKFDYEEFKINCIKVGIEAQPILEFAQKAGMVSSAVIMYPDLPTPEAYLKLIQENQVIFQIGQHQPKNTLVTPKPCNSCGGGEVL